MVYFFFHSFCMSWLDSPSQNWHFFFFGGGKQADLYKDIVLSLVNSSRGVNILKRENSSY